MVGNSMMILGGDILVEVDGQPIDSKPQLDRIVDNKKPGEVVIVKIYRQKRPMSLRVPLIEGPSTGSML